MVLVDNQKITKDYCLYQSDCMEAIQGIKDNIIEFSIFSPPFAELYSYSDSPADLGNCQNYNEFFKHFGFLVKELERVLMPGRIVAVHAMDLPVFKGKEGYIGLKDFSGDIIRLFQKHDFIFHSRHCIWKDPLLAATRTKALGLAHKQLIKDSSYSRMGLPDYVLAFKKHGENPKPIPHPKGLTEYVGERSVPRDLDRFMDWEDTRSNKRSHWIWQQYASPVWDDIRQGRVLPFRAGKDKDDTKHICTLQLDVIERCMVLWSTEGDKVLTPFMGVGSEVYVAVKMKRKGIGIELKRSYYRQAVRNLESLKKNQSTNNTFEKMMV